MPSRFASKVYAADRIFSQVVRQRADHLCEYCQRRPATDCSHIVGRREFSVRWSLDNATALCRHCHDRLGSDPVGHMDWINRKWPKRNEILMVKRRGILKNNAANRKLIAAHYRAELKKMAEDPTYEAKSWN